ncbi:glycosyltransferase family protein [Belliella aquatica]|uniref:Glycosyl transferase n=1 Tax=Belliella aquatica TaxID=1323734 RepID=A0ABQ1N4F3_9BACT|nr:glycosyltransferase family protein [Belliella aquatica]MCH7406982.1 glycosyltransferase [Belliella aquatica]GGC50863.1 glycosyl transferase [Belliella aquatica]
MKFLFIIQGEGRGHMTQAIALADILENAGHEVVASCIGKSKRREIPAFVYQNLKSPIHPIESPNFETDANHKQILLGKTLRTNFFKIRTFQRSLRKIDALVKELEPDIIVNFYDLLGGMYNLIFRPKAQFWVIGHQYMIHHPEFKFAKAKGLEKQLFKLNTKLTAMGADKIFGLSFIELENNPNSKFKVIPPLLRKAIFDLEIQEGDFILTYMVNPGYGEEVIHFAEENPQIKIEAFWDKNGVEKIYQPSPNLIFHQVDDKLFLQKMASCKGLICTSGFESICEAMYLGKPVMMIPVAGQYEQACNALDAMAAGAGISHYEFDFRLFDHYLSTHEFEENEMRTWVNLLTQSIKEEIHALETKSNSRGPTFSPRWKINLGSEWV